MILPGHFALSLDSSIDDTETIRGIWADTEPGLTEDTSGDLHLAGQVVGTWLPDYVSIGSDAVGSGLFLDLRHGPMHGCVRTWDKVNADEATIEAPSLAEFIEALAISVTTGQRYKYWAPTFPGGHLEWDI